MYILKYSQLAFSKGEVYLGTIITPIERAAMANSYGKNKNTVQAKNTNKNSVKAPKTESEFQKVLHSIQDKRDNVH